MSWKTSIPTHPAIAGPSKNNEPPPTSPLPIMILPDLFTQKVGKSPSSTKLTLFSSPQSFNEVSSSSDEYTTADSKDKESAENIKSSSPHLPIVLLDLFNGKN
ncbi:hypothetical protein GLOIN_2v1764380 [Rhizophagus irregularis DAOM 181602=DAOM 197198]|uniref:Uncharacterized protein n=1 Tax=Rhizophagus irregularis (strain DAOM 181602 / DAOM 197198 / MUCL 43194) TaxID=747089 RepID=A0A2P4QSC6_RHIID|nr:hypothetical protein GLOIN_2v1764380 [Rhizophagus irregularis DAOM 181602=DAOM 197198]POG80530.1 hypothetical protein GLOIN_2v1764380 [Rhizophagus irregularis DAOM 181602=DAOM 197198]|eukprot:XP_025187396.1 hypothetical protein GLOIN_2v1764380 [Rhizophagus irregularis DAOM 181602=DAOM 197198]